ncbi:MAG: response regulator [Nitrospirae bacterium]|nr:MAG: response regulator [Nitrospirota bacterium]
MPTVLIVEDSPTMRQLIAFTMRRIPDSRVIEATDGVDALKKLSSEPVDIVLCDINMPVMDGLKLISLIRGNPQLKDIPIVIITTEGAEEDRKRALRMGANDYLTKPIQTHQLVEVVRKYLKKS